MLSACNGHGEVLAEEVTPEDGPFHCPACLGQVILKTGCIKIPHFAHLPNAECAYTSEGESEEHRQAKQEIYRALLPIPGVSDIRLERYLGEVRPDVSFVLHGELVAIEIQLSQLSREELAWRTQAYARKNIAVLWTSSFSWGLCESRYAPRDWEHYLHRMYFGKVYYWLGGMHLQPVRFEEYLLEPNWFSGERYRSKRFVSPTLLPQRSMLDLVARWRSAWRDVPRAKLWCEPWEDQ